MHTSSTGCCSGRERTGCAEGRECGWAGVRTSEAAEETPAVAGWTPCQDVNAGSQHCAWTMWRLLRQWLSIIHERNATPGHSMRGLCTVRPESSALHSSVPYK